MSLNKVVDSYKDVFGNLGTLKNHEYETKIDKNTRPTKISFRRLPPALHEPVISQIKDWEKQRIIKKTSEYDWCSPLVPIRKKNW